MAQTLSQVGRAKLLHPDLAFDTDDGGTALHGAINTMWTQVSNHLPSRWTGSITLADTASAAVTHNFNLAIGKLKIIMFEAGVQLDDTQIAASYTITQTSVNAINIQNTSGGSKTFDALILAFRLPVTSSDITPGDPVLDQGNWDTTNGTSWNKSLYVNGPYTVATAQEYENVIIIGALTLNANLTVRGRLVVVGNVTGVGYKFNCDGDVWINGDVSITGIAAPTMTIGGSLWNKTAGVAGKFIFKGNSSSQGTLTIKKDVQIFSSTDSIGEIETGSETNAAGNHIRIYGNAICSLDTSGNGVAVDNSGMNGGNININGDVICGSAGIITSGSTGTAISCGNAGSININGYVNIISGSMFANGGNATNLNSGNGANIVVGGDLYVSAAVSTVGGTVTGTGNGGTSGNLTVYGDVYAGSIDLSGANAATSGSGSDSGNFTSYGRTNRIVSTLLLVGGSSHVAGTLSGVGGNVSCKGDIYIEDYFNLTGGSYGSIPKKGGDLTATNLHITGSSNYMSGGNVNGGAGGTLTLHGDLRHTDSTYSADAIIYAKGGTSTKAGVAGGVGSTILIAGYMLNSKVIADGGTTTGGAAGGNGGPITIKGGVDGAGASSIQSVGGATAGSATGGPGNGGAVIIGSFNGGTIRTYGGANSSGLSTAAGGNGGNITVHGNFRSSTDTSILAYGGDFATTGGSGNGGAGGTVSIKGSSMTYGIQTYGGNITQGTGAGGAGGPVTITGDAYCIGSFSTKGGDSTSATGGNGGNGGLVEIGGNLIKDNASEFVVKGGNSTNGNGGNAANTVKIGGNYISPKGNSSGNPFIFDSRGGTSSKTSGSATGGNGTTITVGGNWNIQNGYIRMNGGDAQNSGLTSGVGGHSSNGSTYMAVIVMGSISWYQEISSASDITTWEYCYGLMGGNGRTQGGYGGGIFCAGHCTINWQLNVSQGSCTNGTGPAGYMSWMQFMGGATIAKLYAASVAGTERSWAIVHFFMGSINIGHWDVHAGRITNTSTTIYSGGYNGSCTVTIAKATNMALISSNPIPSQVVGARTVVVGHRINGSQYWNYRTFDNV